MPALHMLGSFVFDGWKGTPKFPQEELGIQSREGVDGQGVYSLGRRGQPWFGESIVGAASYDAGVAIAAAYAAASAMDPLVLVINNSPVTVCLYKVLSVDPEVRRCLVFKRAGSNLYQGAEVRAKWTLLPMA